MVALTIGMATYNDYDGVYFTIQALRLYQDVEDTEFVVVDNYGCETTKSLVEGWIKGKYVLLKDAVGTAFAKDQIFRAATGDAVLVCDSHILFEPGAIAKLKAYYRDHPDTTDLLQGPLIYDDLTSISTHFDPVWRGQMWGIWATDPRGTDPNAEPFEIPMQGMGVFSCRRAAWQGFNPLFRGFGGEEGYIHEKFRQAGARCLCLPFLRWTHRFGRPGGIPYPLTVEEKLRNYVLGFAELGLDLAPVIAHFNEHLPEGKAQAVAAEALREGAEAFLTISPAPEPIPRARDYSPLVSCICLTYNRPPEKQELVEEAIESFLRQDYPNKELIVLNDCPEQELVCDAPGVRIVNAPARFPTLGDKYNAAVRLSQGELIAVWDDDDVSLPWRLTSSVERLGAAAYFNPGRYWQTYPGEVLRPDGGDIGHMTSLYTRDAFEIIGGYPSVSSAMDTVFHDALLAQMEQAVHPSRGNVDLARPELYYIYRMGISPTHISANWVGFYDHIGTLPVQPGRFVLNPHWHRDYEAETRALLAEEQAAAAR